MTNENGREDDALQQIVAGEPDAATAQTVANAYHGPYSMSACDKLTMETMMNVEAFSKYMNRRSRTTGPCPDTSERKFYRRRIVDTTKEMLRDSKYINDGTVTNSFNAYVNACIMHFKFIDLADTIQDEYSDLSAETKPAAAHGGSDANVNDDPEHAAAAAVMKMNKLCFNPNVEESKSVLIRTPHANAIERLFVSKPIHLESNTATAASATAATIKPPKISCIPRTKDVNIKDAQFKTKGIKPNKRKPKNKSDKVEPESGFGSGSLE